MNLEKLVEYSKVKLERLNEMLTLTQKQRTAIEGKDIDELNDLVKRKQKVIDHIERYDRLFLEHADMLKKHKGVASLAELVTVHNTGSAEKSLVDIVGAIKALLEKIQMIEKENYDMMLNDMKETMYKLKNVRQGKKGYRGYNPGVHKASGSFIDKKK